ncbi:hypothetical protein FRB93_004551 [Tulasnella sp. JGI-2019a]|nr:hypothetical protein FRB93_004551 [Tulasnella sp. JGI-2019a]
MSDSKTSPLAPEVSSDGPPAYCITPPGYSATEAERSRALGNEASDLVATSQARTEEGFWTKIGSRVIAALRGTPTGEDPHKGTEYEGMSVYQITTEAESNANNPFPIGGLGSYDAFDPAAKQRRLELDRKK